MQKSGFSGVFFASGAVLWVRAGAPPPVQTAQPLSPCASCPRPPSPAAPASAWNVAPRGCPPPPMAGCCRPLPTSASAPVTAASLSPGLPPLTGGFIPALQATGTAGRPAASWCGWTVSWGLQGNKGVTPPLRCHRHFALPVESRLVLVASLGSVGAVTAVGLAAAGGYYLKSTACKKGEYNVRDAEGSLEAACLHRQHRGQAEVYGIQLTQP